MSPFLTDPEIGYVVGSAPNGGKGFWGSPFSLSDVWGKQPVTAAG